LFDIEPIHASAVEVDGRAACLLGDSGAGKSSVAAALTAQGHDLVSDDACALDTQGRVWPGPGLLSLRGVVDGRRMISKDTEKTFVAASCAAGPLTTGAIVKLDRRGGAPLALRPMTRVDAFVETVRMSRS